MTTTRDNIRGWLERGAKAGRSYMLVVCDTFDHSDYPVFADTPKEVWARCDAPGEMQRVMEVYDLADDWETQLREHRAFHLPPRPTAEQVP